MLVEDFPRESMPARKSTSALLCAVLAIWILTCACTRMRCAGELDARDQFTLYGDAGTPPRQGDFALYMPAPAAELAGGADMVRLNLRDTDRPASGSTAIRVDAVLRPPNWAGVAFGFPDYWGERDADTCWDLRGMRRLVFEARGARGGECIQVQVAIAGDRPFGDSQRPPVRGPWITLGTGWKRFELDVSHAALRRVVTPFAVFADTAHNPSCKLTFYLDDIRFERGDEAR